MESHHYCISNHDLELEYSPQSDFHVRVWWIQGLMDRYSRREIEDHTYRPNKLENAVL